MASSRRSRLLPKTPGRRAPDSSSTPRRLRRRRRPRWWRRRREPQRASLAGSGTAASQPLTYSVAGAVPAGTGTLLPRPRALLAATPPHLCCLTAVPTLRDPLEEAEETRHQRLPILLGKAPPPPPRNFSSHGRLVRGYVCVPVCVCVSPRWRREHCCGPFRLLSVWGHCPGPPGMNWRSYTVGGCRISAGDTIRNRRWKDNRETVRIVASPACRCRPNFFCACLRDSDAGAPHLEMHLVRSFRCPFSAWATEEQCI